MGAIEEGRHPKMHLERLEVERVNISSGVNRGSNIMAYS